MESTLYIGTPDVSNLPEFVPDPAAMAKFRQFVAGLRAERERCAPLPVSLAAHESVFGRPGRPLSHWLIRPGRLGHAASVTPGHPDSILFGDRPRPDDGEPATRGDVRKRDRRHARREAELLDRIERLENRVVDLFTGHNEGVSA
jgi:hypothetical protein